MKILKIKFIYGDHVRSGVYILQNTMVVGEGEWLLGKQIKTEGVGGKMKKKGKGKRKITA